MTKPELLARLNKAAQVQDRAAAELKERMATEGPDGAGWHGYGMHVGASIAYRAAAIWVSELEACDLKLMQRQVANIIQRQTAAHLAECPDATPDDVAMDCAAQVVQALPVLGQRSEDGKADEAIPRAALPADDLLRWLLDEADLGYAGDRQELEWRARSLLMQAIGEESDV